MKSRNFYQPIRTSMLFPNDAITIKSLSWTGIKKTYATTVATGVACYFYENDQSLNSAYGIDWGQEVKKMMTNYMSINEWYRLTDKASKNWIVKKVITRSNVFKKFLEVIVVSDYV